MISALTRLIRAAFKYYVVAEMAHSGRRATRRLRHVVFGATLCLVSLLFVTLGVTILIGGLFFQLAELYRYVTPALISGGVSLLIALVTFLEGTRRFRR